MEKSDVFSKVRYLDIKNMSTDEIRALIICFNTKTKLIENELRKRKNNGQIFVLSPATNNFIESKNVYSFINNFNINTLSNRELVHLMDLFSIKSRQMQKELSERS